MKVPYELQIEDAPSAHARTYKKIGMVAGVITLGCVIIVILATTIPESRSKASDQSHFFSPPNQTLVYPTGMDEIPCTVDGTPKDCVQRYFKCGTIPTRDGTEVIPPATNTGCLRQGAIKALETYIVQFYDQNRDCWEVKMKVAECWAMHPVSKTVYSCQGKCGPGCGTINCGAWAKDCLRHDACSWYYNAKDGGSDPNCGQSYNLAADDIVMNCACSATGGTDKSFMERC